MRLTARIAATCNRSGAARNDVVGAAAMPVVSGHSEGSGAPSSTRVRSALALLALAIAAFAISAAPASAAPPLTTMGSAPFSAVSYASAHVSGKITTSGGTLGSTSYTFQYSKNPGTEGWTAGPGGSLTGAKSDETVQADITGLRGETKYFVRLTAFVFGPGFVHEEGVSPEPSPSFTTLVVDPPTIVATNDASAIFSQSAAAAGKVKRPANADPAFDISACRFEYVTDAEFTATGFQGATPAACEPSPPYETPNGETDVSAQLTGLSAATTYHLRLAVENAAPGAATKEAAHTFTTLPAVAKPIVLATDDASVVRPRSVQASGEIERPAGADPALNFECRFEYVSDAQFTENVGNSLPGFEGAVPVPCAQNPVTSSAPGFPAVSAAVSAELPGLEPNTTYHLRLTAENGGGTDSKDAAATFTTLAVVHPTLTVDSITEIGYTGFRVTGTFDPGNQGIYPGFEFSPAGKEEWGGSGAAQFEPLLVAAGSPAEQLSANFPCYFAGGSICTSPLKPGTTYQVRAYGYDNEFGGLGELYYSPEPYPEFTTLGTNTPPSATLSISGVTGTSAHFSGTVDTHAPAGPLPDEAKPPYKTAWHIECTPECKDANENVIAGTVEAEEGSKAISVDTRRLEPGTHYAEVKLIATDALGTVETPLQSFDTPVIPPTVKAAPGNFDGKGGYTLQGIVNPENNVVSACNFEWGPNSAEYTFSAPCSPLPSEGSKPITVEAHLTGLTPGATYHDKLVVTYGAGSKVDAGDQSFVPTLSPPETCENEQLRKENNSLALPECRAYEMVSSPFKEGFDASFGSSLSSHTDYAAGGDRVLYSSGAVNIAKSGFGSTTNYAADRTLSGWETIPDLNGASGSLKDAPSEVTTVGAASRFYSKDLLSSVWAIHRKTDPAGTNFYLRNPDGTFTLLGLSGSDSPEGYFFGASENLSHVFFGPDGRHEATPWGLGVYEFVGIGNEQPPRRADVDNSGTPITTCTYAQGTNALPAFSSTDGRVYVFSVKGDCGGANPPTNEVWARVNGTTSFDVSASQCNRTAADPGGVCNGPIGSGGCSTTADGGEEGPGCRGAQFQAASADGSRIFFTSNQQLVNGDTDQTNDLYACDIPSGSPAPTGKANPCASLRQISVAEVGAAEVENVQSVAEDGSTVMFTAKGVLAGNEDALKEQALAGDNNLYVWHQDAAHPEGQTSFVGRLVSACGSGQAPQITPDGRDLVFTTATSLVPTDTDTACDVYRYDVESEQLTRVSIGVSGTGGNAGFDAEISSGSEHHPNTAISGDGQKIVFTTTEPLSPADGNGEPDAYLWTPGHVSLISTGAVAGGVAPRSGVITTSGHDIFFDTHSPLTPADQDLNGDVYDARVEGGFSFAQVPSCSGEACQPGASNPPASGPLGTQGTSSGNPIPPKPCPKGKVRRHGKCVKKHTKGQKHKSTGNKRSAHEKSSHNRGGGK